MGLQEGLQVSLGSLGFLAALGRPEQWCHCCCCGCCCCCCCAERSGPWGNGCQAGSAAESRGRWSRGMTYAGSLSHVHVTRVCHLRRDCSSPCSRLEDPIMLLIARKLKKFWKITHTRTQLQTYTDTHSNSHVNLAAAESCQDNFTIHQFLQQDQITAHSIHSS